MAKAHRGLHAFEGRKVLIRALVPWDMPRRLARLGKRRSLDKSDIVREALALWEERELGSRAA